MVTMSHRYKYSYAEYVQIKSRHNDRSNWILSHVCTIGPGYAARACMRNFVPSSHASEVRRALDHRCSLSRDFHFHLSNSFNYQRYRLQPLALCSIMDPDDDLALGQYINSVIESLDRFTQRANAELLSLADSLNRSQANLLILENKLATFQND